MLNCQNAREFSKRVTFALDNRAVCKKYNAHTNASLMHLQTFTFYMPVMNDAMNTKT